MIRLDLFGGSSGGRPRSVEGRSITIIRQGVRQSFRIIFTLVDVQARLVRAKLNDNQGMYACYDLDLAGHLPS